MLEKRNLQGLLLVVTLLSVFVTGVLQEVKANDELKKTPEEVIRYQEVFFHFYRKDEYQALVNLTAGLKDKNIIANKFANELLLGNLYLMYGLPDLAEKSLKLVAEQSGAKKQKVLALFYLAKKHFDNAEYVEFLSLISKINKDLPSGLNLEKDYMLGMSFINQGRYQFAEEILDDMDSGSDWYEYLAFNLGATYLKLGENDQGEKLLERIGKKSFESEDMLSLKDKSNIVLGYYYIRAGKSKNAISVLESVRLDGPFSNKALLGLGWAYSQQERYRDALVPWLALAEKDELDVTVQEAKLASAFAYRQLGGEIKAMKLYKDAINKYSGVRKYFNDEVSTSFTRNVFSPLLKTYRTDDYGVTLGIQRELKEGKGIILVDLLEEETFQKMFNDYRDLKQLQHKLTIWRQDLKRMDVALSLKEAEKRVDEASVNRFTSYDGLNNKELLLTLSDTVQLQNDRMEILLGMYEEKIRDEFVRALNTKQQYLIAYLSQARFALAEILDSAQKKEAKSIGDE